MSNATRDEIEGGLGVDEPNETSSQAQDQKPDNVVPFVPRAATGEPSAPVTAPVKPPHDPGSSSFWWIPGGMLATAAAAIVLWWVWPPSEDVLELGDGTAIAERDEALPNYVLETDGGLEQPRGTPDAHNGSDDARHRYRRDTSFEWVLRPKSDVEAPVSVRGFAFVDGGRVGLPLQLDALAEVAPAGVIRVAGKIADLNLEPGRYTIALAVGRLADLPTQATGVASREDGAAWMVRRIDVIIEE